MLTLTTLVFLAKLVVDFVTLPPTVLPAWLCLPLTTTGLVLVLLRLTSLFLLKEFVIVLLVVLTVSVVSMRTLALLV